MPARIVPDVDKPSAAIEIPLQNPLPDYDLDQLDQPTPRDVDAVLVSQGFRDLVDDARGVLLDILANPPEQTASGHQQVDLDLTHQSPKPFELLQLTGAICPGDDEVYRPGLWIVLRDPRGNPKAALSSPAQARVRAIADEFMRRLQLD
jgi:hypothetical protein